MVGLITDMLGNDAPGDGNAGMGWMNMPGGPRWH